MKVLTAAQMREIDARAIESGIPGIILMENAAHRVVEFVATRFAPANLQRIVILCGAGNNGGDGLAIARQLYSRFSPRSLEVVLACAPDELRGDAQHNLRMLRACGMDVSQQITPYMRHATLLIDALLGTGIRGAARGRTLELIEEINNGFPYAKVVAVDVPSGMASDAADNEGPFARTDATVTFTVPKICHALPPNCDRLGELLVAPIGISPSPYQGDANLFLSLVEPSWFSALFTPRWKGAHKGDFGHVLVVAGSVGKTGAASMAGLAALRAGAGLVTVASASSAIAGISMHSPELMTEALRETETGAVSSRAYPALEALSDRKSILAVGPGMGTHPDTITFLQTLFERLPVATVMDADAITALAGAYARPGGPRILTPHPGEMARFCNCTVTEVQSDRAGIARTVAVDRELTIVLKGQRTLIAFPDGRVWINPTGSPAMATAGSGDILTGMIAGMMSQFPSEADYAIAAAVWLHGRAGEIGAAALGDKALIATDLLHYLPEAMRELTNLHHEL
ncbi:MAG TPA: NAD(P)H-hydrate dehydratase [Bryobacteraceae bacterium]|nr:NAD(P)H-hydrate dehydratase [Bryobacteraceae bacterium]